jgi:peptidoglycan-associated lipoprotein
MLLDTGVLVGRADPRGSEDYNMNLGEERAATVARHLRYKGVPAEAITTQSQGELDARGHDEETWALDRCVDIMTG